MLKIVLACIVNLEQQSVWVKQQLYIGIEEYSYQIVHLYICRLIQKSLSELTKAAAEKQVALAMDRSAFKLRNTSRGLEFQDGIENFDNTSVHVIYVIPIFYVLSFQRIIFYVIAV